ncbi:MAG TPA: hypothetical protein VG014_04550 [Acidimicrobiales bacterium]|nr:hypothetical protein [Acidimicrobiales bacterium]
MSGPTEHDDEEPTGQDQGERGPAPVPGIGQSVSQPPPPSPPSLRFDGAVLVGSGEPGTATVGDLTLLIDERAVTIVSRQPPDQRIVPWSAITNVWCGPTGVDSMGRVATPLDITSANRTVRFLLYGDRAPEAEVSQLRSWLPIWQGSPPPQPAVSNPLNAPVPPFAGAPPPPFGPVGMPPPPAAPPPFPAAPPPPPPPFPPPGPPGWTPTPYGPPLPPFYGGYPPSPFAPPPLGLPPIFAPLPRRRRFRRPATLVIALGLIVAGGGLAAVLLAVTNHNPPSTSNATRTVSPDQGLANQLMLTAKDLPAGWQAGDNTSGASQHDLAVQDQINKTFNRCMSISADQGNVALGGQAADQTAQAASPPFLAPTPTAPGGSTTVPGAQGSQASTLELQTDANIVKTHADEQRDFTLFTSPKFPQCNAAAVAAALQLGLNDATGGNATAGPATAKVVDLVAPRGEQVMGVTMQFTISDGTTQIPTEVDQLVVGTSRTEAQLQALAIGAQFPSDVLSAAVSTFELRVADQGTGTTA